MNRLLLTLAACLVVAQAAAAQEAPAPGTPLALAARAKVQKELKLTAEQVRTVEALAADVKKGTVKPADARGKLKKALEPEQLARLKEISYQVRGGAALQDADVASALELTKKQKEKIAEIRSDADRTLRMLLAVARFRNAEAQRNFIRNHYKEAGRKMLDVLSAEQKKQFTTMQGKTFDVAGLDR